MHPVDLYALLTDRIQQCFDGTRVRPDVHEVPDDYELMSEEIMLSLAILAEMFTELQLQAAYRPTPEAPWDNTTARTGQPGDKLNNLIQHLIEFRGLRFKNTFETHEGIVLEEDAKKELLKTAEELKEEGKRLHKICDWVAANLEFIINEKSEPFQTFRSERGPQPARIHKAVATKLPAFAKEIIETATQKGWSTIEILGAMEKFDKQGKSWKEFAKDCEPTLPKHILVNEEGEASIITSVEEDQGKATYILKK